MKRTLLTVRVGRCMGEPPVFDNPESKMIAAVPCFGIDEVRAAAEGGSSIAIPIAVVEGRRQEVHMMVLSGIAYVNEVPGGFRFSGSCRQLLTTVLHEYEVETTYQLIGRSSICHVEVVDGLINLSFSTVVMINQVTGIFAIDY